MKKWINLNNTNVIGFLADVAGLGTMALGIPIKIVEKEGLKELTRLRILLMMVSVLI